MRVNGEEPFRLGGLNESDTAKFEADAREEWRHFPGGLRATQEAYDGAGDVEKSEGAKIPDVFFVGYGLTDKAADQARGSGGGHAQPLVTYECRDSDDGTAERADDAAAE